MTDERELMRDALKRSMGEASFAEVKTQFENRVQSGDLIEVRKQIAEPRVHHRKK